MLRASVSGIDGMIQLW